MKIATAAMLAAFLFVGCDTTSDVVELTEQEAALFGRVGIDLETARRIRALGNSVEQLRGFDEDWNYYDADGVVLMTPANRWESTLLNLRSMLDRSRYSAYLLDQGFGFGPDSIAILANTDRWFYLQTVRINGVNYGVEHDDVIERLKDWDAKYGLRLIGAGMDWLQAEFETPPQDWAAFANEVYEFCPDVVVQGTGSVEALAVELKQMRGVYLWWD